MSDVKSLLNELEALGRESGLGRVEELAHLLRQSTTQDQAALSAAGAIEIERKYLLSDLPESLSGRSGRALAQGYLPGERLIERIRRIDHNGQSRFIRTVKLGEGVARVEIEEACDETVFETLWSLTAGRRIEKTRYAVPEGEYVWEIDAFKGQALFLAEIELPSVDSPVSFPAWLAPYIVREVTGERDYTNWALSC